jgi:hypothetical protein
MERVHAAADVAWLFISSASEGPPEACVATFSRFRRSKVFAWLLSREQDQTRRLPT